MFRILLVDDEPLILAGIKFMIDWNKNDFEIVGTARNGKEALQKIEETRPQVILTDLSMPVIDGLELLRQANDKYPHIVFLVLTNLEEFSSAQDALRLKAIDYIIKSSLEPEILEKALKKAKIEVENRENLERVEMVENYINNSQKSLVEHAILNFFTKSKLSKESINLLQEKKMLSQFSAIQIQFYLDPFLEQENFQQLVQWEFELVEKLAKNCFENSHIIKSTSLPIAYLFCWNISSLPKYHENIKNFSQRLNDASQNITTLVPYLQATGIYDGTEQLGLCQQDLESKKTQAYLTGEKIIIDSPRKSYQTELIPVESYSNRLKFELNSHNRTVSMNLILRAKQKLKTTEHQKSKASWLCSEFYMVLQECGVTNEHKQSSEEKNSEKFFPLNNFVTRDHVLSWLDQIVNSLENDPSFFSSSKTDLIEKAKQFTYENIDKKISLQQIASHIGMSTSYFSAFFKQETNQNFIDYVNALKIERSKELIKEQKYRMNEISSMLGFENAYYFSKVFRRYTGTTPSKYQQDL